MVKQQELAVVVSNANKNNNAYETIDAIKKAGFKNVFIQWYNQNWCPSQEEQLEYIKKQNLNIIFAHLGYRNINVLWLPGKEGDELIASYKNDIKIMAQNDINLVVMHLVSRKDVPKYNEIGLKRMKDLVNFAKKLNVKIALENVEIKEHLEYVMNNIKADNLGICFDSGHFHTFFHDDYDISKYKNKVFAVHLHDNIATGDLHLMPFDGTVNWDEIVKKLKEANYSGPITMELVYQRDYLQMNIEEFYKRGYKIGKELQKMF